ncbi:MAG: IclR family transcriptional regulator [Limnochordales bacterium]|nr:IclR family transcriptional regulator [Limnochordales bacterium]
MHEQKKFVDSVETTKVKSLQKAIQVLKCFTSSHPELRVTEISRMLALNKSTVYNILATLEAEGLVEQDRESGKYRLGLELLRLANIVREGLGLRKVALPAMEKAKELFQETVHLAIEQDGYVVYLESVQPLDRSVARLATGKRAYMHCTGVGKAILAYLPDERVDEILARHGMARYTPNTITSPEALKAELAATRRRGYAIDNMEHEWGIRCIAVPIRDETGRVVASISVSGPSERLPLEELGEMAQPLIALGLDVSRRLGWSGY